MTSNQKQYNPEKCECCGQSTTYLLPIDKGTSEILVEVAQYIKTKGINAVHPRKELESTGALSSNQVGNMTRLRVHGLIAKVKDEPANYLLTRKGIDFLKGYQVPRYAIVDKTAGGILKGYWKEEDERCTIEEMLDGVTYWDGAGFDIKQGRVITGEQQRLL